jgi:hypothetical protein
MTATPLGSLSGPLKGQTMMNNRRKKYFVHSAKYPRRNKHHLLPRSRGGDNSPDNVLLLKVNRHFYWHRLFGARSLEEVILLLVRVHRAKGRCLYAKMGLSCRLAPCFDVRLAPTSNGNSAHKATVVQMPKQRTGAGAANGNPRVLQHRPRDLSGQGEQRSGKGRQVSRLKAIPAREMKKSLREGKP